MSYGKGQEMVNHRPYSKNGIIIETSVTDSGKKTTRKEREQTFQNSLEQYRRLDELNIPSGIKWALSLCRQNNRPLPDWLHESLNKIMEKQECIFLNDYKQDRIDRARYWTVFHCRYPDGSTASPIMSWVESYEAASEKLENTEAKGGASAIEASYKRYRKLQNSNTRDKEVVDKLPPLVSNFY